ncbi:hypothetical protein F2Q70_00015280 [Brassica cretica]|uniref:Uncharacterized protein n=1 Tax=Brassica cretica TaxID=69181 RepID=A0A8S9I4H4_BRACR|nr:hypothetical protein F2Q70_00015280 [Brassica cretica]
MLQSKGLRNAARVNKEAAMECYKAGRFGRAKDKAYVASYFFPELPGLRRLNAVLQKRYRKLFLDMTMDDGESLVGTYKANKIFSDSWKFLCNEKGKKLYDMRRRDRLQLRERQLRSSLFVPVVLSAPKPNMSNEQMVQPPPPSFRVSGGERKRKASSSTTVPHVNKGRKKQ